LNLTAHFSLEELTHSDLAMRKGIDNQPPDEILDNLHTLAYGLERVRTILNAPIYITSGYRSPKVNAAVGSNINSAHVKGLAADFHCPGFGTPKQVAEKIAQEADFIDFDQIIHEGKWVHLAFSHVGSAPRRNVLTAQFPGPSYVKGIV